MVLPDTLEIRIRCSWFIDNCSFFIICSLCFLYSRGLLHCSLGTGSLTVYWSCLSVVQWTFPIKTCFNHYGSQSCSKEPEPMLGQVTTASSWAFCTAWLQAQCSPRSRGSKPWHHHCWDAGGRSNPGWKIAGWLPAGPSQGTVQYCWLAVRVPVPRPAADVSNNRVFTYLLLTEPAPLQ